MSFQIAGFEPSAGHPAPADPVTGTIVWEAASIHSPVQSFDSINLTLDRHTYSIEELGYMSQQTKGVVGGKLNQPNSVLGETDDFFIVWDRDSLQPHGFCYASSRSSGIWSIAEPVNPGSFTSFSITQVPEPRPIALAALFLAALCLVEIVTVRKLGQPGRCRLRFTHHGVARS